MGIISGTLDDLNYISKAASSASDSVYNTLSSVPNRKSISRGANDATFQFPILTSNTIPLDMAATIARTMERVYAAFVQQWLSVNQQIDLSRDKSPVEFLKKFHQNIKLEKAIEDLTINEDEYHAYIEGAYNGEYDLYMNPERTYGVLFNRTLKASPIVTESHKQLLREYMSEFDLKPIMLATEAPGEADMLDAIINGSMQKAGREQRQANLDATDHAKAPQIFDKDVKKSNDLLPYQLQVRLLGVNGDKEFVQYIDFVLGIKAILHPIKSDEIVDNACRAVKNRSLFFKFLRWTSGEISMVKNILLNLDDMRADAASLGRGSSKWFPTLKHLRSQKAKINPRTFTINSVIPNSTLVLTQFECDKVQSMTGVDLRNPRLAKNMIHELFLLAFIIVDDGAGTIDVLFEDSTEYQTYALETLEREVSLSSNKIGKEIGRMLSH